MVAELSGFAAMNEEFGTLLNRTNGLWLRVIARVTIEPMALWRYIPNSFARTRIFPQQIYHAVLAGNILQTLIFDFRPSISRWAGLSATRVSTSGAPVT